MLLNFREIINRLHIESNPPSSSALVVNLQEFTRQIFHDVIFDCFRELCKLLLHLLSLRSHWNLDALVHRAPLLWAPFNAGSSLARSSRISGTSSRLYGNRSFAIQHVPKQSVSFLLPLLHILKCLLKLFESSSKFFIFFFQFLCSGNKLPIKCTDSYMKL